MRQGRHLAVAQGGGALVRPECVMVRPGVCSVGFYENPGQLFLIPLCCLAGIDAREVGAGAPGSGADAFRLEHSPSNATRVCGMSGLVDRFS
ncbi:MAG: hypothetical protein ABGZ17_06570, partial [Planctomycetaceae bacterium]